MAHDLAIIGSGAAAFAAAITARDLGATVVMVERGMTGGTCVNTGCVPSKALLAAANARHFAIVQCFPGIATQAGPADVAALTIGKDELVAQMRATKYTDLAAYYGWEIIAGSARFAGGPAEPRLDVAVNGESGTAIEAARYLVATGAAPWAPPIDGLEQSGYLTSAEAMELAELPDSLTVIGGNAVGLEMAQLFARLGVQVTIVEARDRLAPFEEPEVSAAIEEVLGDEGIEILTDAVVTSAQRDAGISTVSVRSRSRERTLIAGQVLVATGRRPSTGGLNLAAVGVRTGEHGQIVIDEFLRTASSRIWAAGDVTGGPQFVYVAATQGARAAENALSYAQRSVDYSALPRVTFTSPAIASAGLTEAQLIQGGARCDCRVVPLEAVPRAVVSRDTRGLIKLVAEGGTGRVRGVHAIADGAGEVIAAAVYAIRAGMTVTDLAGTWAPYLTMSEGLRLAAQAFSRDVSRLSCCAG